MAKESKSNIKQEFNTAQGGLNLDNSQNNIKKGVLSYALNAVMENFDSNSIQYQNEPGNELCFEFPEGFQLLGKYFIPEKSKIIFWLKNPDTEENEIGYMIDNNCQYKTLVNNVCLNFDINRPILSGAHRILDNGDVEIYWADNNGRRFLNIDDIPYLPKPNSTNCSTNFSDNLDCNSLSLQPFISIPLTSVEDVISGGDLISGTYQFTVQYSDANGNPYTAYFNVTNPLPLADIKVATPNFNTPVGKSIVVNIKNLDPNGVYKYFNLSVIKTVNNISTPELIGTYSIDDNFKKITYTGQNKTSIKLSINDIFEKFSFYEGADHVTAVQDILVWNGMTPIKRINYQKIANKIKLKWQSFRIPASDKGYANEINSSKYRSYLRDEVYALEIIFLLGYGKETDAFHIPGREIGSLERNASAVKIDNKDYIGDGKTSSEYWKVYNTATVEGTSSYYTPDKDYKGPYKYGEFAYWESAEEYPCNEEVWGELAGKKIRHHKFPDCIISPIIENPNDNSDLIMEDVAIFSLGVKIDSTQVKAIIQSSDLSKEEKEQIVGYKIVRADRGVNKSIIAKGMLRNVGKYTRENQDYFYPNYPYNDVTEDPFLNSTNNAWSEQCEEYTLEVFNLPTQSDGYKYVEISYVDCNTNKPSTRKITSVGEFKQCSLVRPTWKGVGNYNKKTINEFGQTTAFDVDWRDKVETTDPTVNAILYPSNYDVYRINWKSFGLGAAGVRPEWEDVVTGEVESNWLTYRNNFIVRVPVGHVPFCVDSSCNNLGGSKLREPILLEKVRSTNCGTETSIPSIKDNTELLNRQVFNSPETSFGQPFLGNILSLETVMYGKGKAHFVEVKDNSKYRLITKEAQEDALKTAEKVAELTQTFNLEAMFAVYNAQLTIFRNDITSKNFAKSFNSIASYNYYAPVPVNKGIKNRNLELKSYLIPEVLNVGEKDVNINNYQRETSVYLKATESIPLPDNTLETYSNILTKDNSRFTIGEKGICATPEKEEDISVVSYYGAIKNFIINQYGQINSYESVDTGFVKIFDDNTSTSSSDDIIFGGDTFIGRFSYKTKLPFFLDNRVGFPDDSDIFYDEIGNVGYPKYWHSSRSVLETWQGELKQDLILPNFLSTKAHVFDCPNDQSLAISTDDPSSNPNRTFYDGNFYMFAYGVPSFYCESSYNLDLRTAFNNKEGDFWPHVSTGIPDEWLQETNVPIVQDNTYNYNVTYSKQNKESVITNLPANWNKDNEIDYLPFRSVYSDKQISNKNNRINNWLIYRPSSFFDFPQNYGNLTSLDSIQDAAILARFENKSLLYNSLITIDTSNPQAAFVGNPNLFANQPLDYGETDQGYMGSQNKMLIKTPYGAVSIDAKRGQIFLVNGKQAQDLTQFGSGMQRWFLAHLPFEISKYFPGINTDNHFKDFGLHGVFDNNYKRVILTKLDYIPLDSSIVFKDNKFFVIEKELYKEISLNDDNYFCNVSWTISFNFNTRSWISFHSYTPNWYVGENNFFYSGSKKCSDDFDLAAVLIDTSPTTTTTTTTIPLSTTTTTTTLPVVYDCSFEANIITLDCTIEGEGHYLDSPENNCFRPLGLNTYVLYKGYTLSSTDYDTTSSSSVACVGLNYKNVEGDISDLVLLGESVKAFSISLNNTIYLNDGTQECNYMPDGWYFTEELSATTKEVFRIENGVIVEYSSCVTTTTTTTTLNVQSLCFTGTLPTNDPSSPLGGIIVYYDENNVRQVLSGIWDEDTININAVTIERTEYVIPCP